MGSGCFIYPDPAQGCRTQSVDHEIVEGVLKCSAPTPGPPWEKGSIREHYYYDPAQGQGTGGALFLFIACCSFHYAHIWIKSGISIHWRYVVTSKKSSNPFFSLGNYLFYIIRAQHVLSSRNYTFGVDRFAEGIWLHRKSRQIRFLLGNYLFYIIRAQHGLSFHLI